MKKINYNPLMGKYLTKEVFEQCFEEGKTLSVDKTQCGSGFTHLFLSSTPKEGTVNILIAPNREVVFSKESAYRKDKGNTFKDKTQFFCSGSGDSELDYSTKIIVTTTDSFFGMELSSKLKHLKVGRILLDEWHSTIQQSHFRRVLKGFLNRVESKYSADDVAITTVTATPILYTKIDIQLIPNKFQRSYDIHINNDYPSVIEEISDYLANDEKVIIFTNSSLVISNFIDKSNKERKPYLNAKLMVGSKMLSKQVRKAVVQTNQNFIIGSSTSFEGWDCVDEDVRVYFFQDFSKEEERGFTLGNIYQSFNRTRRGYKKATYCSLSTRKTLAPIEDIVKSVVESKVPNRRYGSKGAVTSINKVDWKQYNRFKNVIVESKSNIGSSYTIDNTLVAYEKEQEIMANEGIQSKDYDEYRKARNINIINERVMQKEATRKSTRQEAWCIYQNRDIIIENGLDKAEFVFDATMKYTGDLETDRVNTMKLFTKQWNTHISYVNYDSYEYPERDYRTHKQRKLSEMLITDAETNRAPLRDFIEEIVSTYTQRKKDALKGLRKGRNDAKIKELTADIKTMETYGFLNILNLISKLVNENFRFEENLVDNRDFNLLTKVSMDAIEKVCAMFDIIVHEYDISSCAVRALYSAVGLELPNDFYGEDKKNKKPINILLNNISKYSNTTKMNSAGYRKEVRRKLKKYNFDEKVIAFILETFFNAYKGAVYYFYTRIEQNICWEVNRIFFNYQGVRRHDSLILFNSMFTGEGLSDYIHNGVKGWFTDDRLLVGGKNPTNITLKEESAQYKVFK